MNPLIYQGYSNPPKGGVVILGGEILAKINFSGFEKSGVVENQNTTLLPKGEGVGVSLIWRVGREISLWQPCLL